MSFDPIVDEVRRVRDDLVKKYGGLEGWIDHLQSMDEARACKTKKRAAKTTSQTVGELPRRKPRGHVATSPGS